MFARSSSGIDFANIVRRVARFVRCAGAALLVTTLASAMTAERLRVEYVDRPLGVDSAHPRLSWILQANERAQRQTAYQIVVASSEQNLAAGRGDVWDTGKVTSSENFGMAYAGPPLRSDTRYFWQVRVWDRDGSASPWSAPSWWHTGLMNSTDWKAKWIGADPDHGSPLLRREFRADKQIVRATAYAYAIGWYRLFINGTEFSERVLAPVNSNYPKGLFYDTYDVTSFVRRGANSVGLWVGQGYNQSYSKWGYRWDAPPAALLQLEIVFSDGSRQTIISDESWNSAPSPILANDIYNGETYDARRDDAGWSRADYDDRQWTPVLLRDAPAGPLKSCPFPGLTVTADLRPVRITEPKPGVFIFDLGQNIAGWVRLRARGEAGTSVILRHAEELLPDGTLDVTTNRAAKATDTFILSGNGDEIYEPRFTYHGFRYVEVTGYPGIPTLDSITGLAVCAAVEDAGSFRCSDSLLNRIHDNFRWTIANNLYGIPTDTATRDERTPCQMDSLAVEDAAICNFDLAAYYTKWLNDIAGDGGNLPNWTGDQVVLPFLLYQNYGDSRILEQHFANMKQVVDKFAATAEETRHWADGFGDWATPNPTGSYEGSFSEGELVNRAFFYRTAQIVAETAALLGRAEDAQRYTDLAAQIRAAFEQHFYNPATATYGSGRQVTSVLPLAFDLVAPAHRSAVAAALRERIEHVDGAHLDTGIFGTRYLFEVLIDHGFTDLAYQVLTTPGYPGYADQIAQGATTTWEQWVFGGSMQTHNHAMFSGPDATLFSRFGGIRPAAPGFREIDIRPVFPTALTFVDCSRQTPMGEVSCHWKRGDDRLTVRLQIPANTTARLYLPSPSIDAVTESGQPANDADGVLAAHHEAGRAVLTLGAGDYDFSVSTAME
jgi:alpha-L-rhamnosidase